MALCAPRTHRPAASASASSAASAAAANRAKLTLLLLLLLLLLHSAGEPVEWASPYRPRATPRGEPRTLPPESGAMVHRSLDVDAGGLVGCGYSYVAASHSL